VDYLVTLVGGLAFGFLLPPQGKIVAVTFLLGVGFVLVTALFAVSFSYNARQITAVFLMLDSPELTRPGLAQLVVVSYGVLIGTLVVAVKLLLKRSKS
jgi:hypothetical protein